MYDSQYLSRFSGGRRIIRQKYRKYDKRNEKENLSFGYKRNVVQREVFYVGRFVDFIKPSYRMCVIFCRNGGCLFCGRYGAFIGADKEI